MLGGRLGLSECFLQDSNLRLESGVAYLRPYAWLYDRLLFWGARLLCC